MRKEELEGQISRLMSEKKAIENWRKAEEKKVDECKKTTRKSLDQINAEKGDLSERQAELKKIENEIAKKDALSSSSLSRLEIGKENLKKEKLVFKETKDRENERLNVRVTELSSKSNDLNKKEKWINNVFKELEDLKND